MADLNKFQVMILALLIKVLKASHFQVRVKVVRLRMPDQKLDLTFNQCGKSLGTNAHPLLNVFISDLRKSSNGNLTDKCPRRGRIDKIENFEISSKYFPPVIVKDFKTVQFDIITSGRIVGERKSKPIYSWKIVATVWI